MVEREREREREERDSITAQLDLDGWFSLCIEGLTIQLQLLIPGKKGARHSNS